SNLLECNGVVLNLSNASLEVNGERVELTKNEFRILQILFEHKGETVTREAIMKHLWDGDCFIDDNTLAVNLTRLRKKLEEYSLNNLITTKKGIGYMLEE
ncbi:MAG: winged helix-turn-helix domain-containing protein, partial [Lachnospiraceae bacterium]|nr:winged helix-turn-helix domain-containing protein [Lachnospiraceae bacterium]